MNADRFTQKSMEALNAAQKLAVEYSNQSLEPEHLLAALAGQQDGLIPQLLKKLGIEPGAFETAAVEKVSQLPHVSGPGRDPEKIYISTAADGVLNAAEAAATRMKDEYISVEHLFLGLLEKPNGAVQEILRAFSLDKNRFMEALAQVRGNQRVTSDNPEETYDALEKVRPGPGGDGPRRRSWTR